MLCVNEYTLQDMEALSDMPIFNVNWLIVAVALTAGFLFLSHLPPEVTPSQLQTGGFDKITHMLGYGVITLLFILALKSPASFQSGFVLFIAIIAVGAVDELTQPFVNRTANLADWLADLVGVTSVLFLFYIVRFKIRRLNPKKSLG